MVRGFGFVCEIQLCHSSQECQRRLKLLLNVTFMLEFKGLKRLKRDLRGFVENYTLDASIPIFSNWRSKAFCSKSSRPIDDIKSPMDAASVLYGGR